MLTVLAKDAFKHVRQVVGENANTPIEVLVCAVEALRDDVLMVLAPSVTKDVLASLATTKKVEVRGALAARPYEPALPVLTRDKLVTARAAVTIQPQTSLEALKVLATDDNVKVRKAVHMNPPATGEINAVGALNSAGDIP